MPTFELPNDLAEFLNEMAKKKGRKDAQEMLLRIVYDLREQELKQKHTKKRPTDKYR
jgi:hypothetical protein